MKHLLLDYLKRWKWLFIVVLLLLGILVYIELNEPHSDGYSSLSLLALFLVGGLMRDFINGFFKTARSLPISREVLRGYLFHVVVTTPFVLMILLWIPGILLLQPNLSLLQKFLNSSYSIFLTAAFSGTIFLISAGALALHWHKQMAGISVYPAILFLIIIPKHVPPTQDLFTFEDFWKLGIGLILIPIGWLVSGLDLKRSAMSHSKMAGRERRVPADLKGSQANDQMGEWILFAAASVGTGILASYEMIMFLMGSFMISYIIGLRGIRISNSRQVLSQLPLGGMNYFQAVWLQPILMAACMNLLIHLTHYMVTKKMPSSLSISVSFLALGGCAVFVAMGTAFGWKNKIAWVVGVGLLFVFNSSGVMMLTFGYLGENSFGEGFLLFSAVLLIFFSAGLVVLYEKLRWVIPKG